MNPSEINRLLTHAKRLLKVTTTLPEAFVLLFIVWEALQRRILRVGLASKGIAKNEADLWMAEMRLASISGFQSAFRAVYGKDLGQVPGLGHLFRNMRKVHTLRHRYVHGRGRASPIEFRECVQILLELIESDWGAALTILLKADGKNPVNANPLTRISVPRLPKNSKTQSLPGAKPLGS